MEIWDSFDQNANYDTKVEVKTGGLGPECDARMKNTKALFKIKRPEFNLKSQSDNLMI